MKIKQISIKNYRILKDITIHPNNVLALVGDNNAGKSTIFRALELFFENSTKLVSKETFHNYDTSKPIEIEIEFTELKNWEKEELNAWMLGDSLVVKRIITADESNNPVIATVAKIKEPKPNWLRVSETNTENIKVWLRQDLALNGKNFKNYLEEGKTTVTAWKDAIPKFIEENRDFIDFETIEKSNPIGYPNVLKGTLPEFILIPAVRDISDETKAVSTTAFGKLLDKLTKNIPINDIETLSKNMQGVKAKLNRSDNNELRISQIKSLEEKLNQYMHEIMNCDIELEFDVPTVKDVISKVHMYATDGIRTPIDMKGHGLQRSAIFTILRTYAELKNQSENEGGELKNRSTIFAFEEPELYLHPQLQRTLFNTLYTIAEQEDQVFYSTHSSLLINISLFDDICILRKNPVPTTCETNGIQLTMQKLVTDLKLRKGKDGTENGMRELYANIFNAEISEGFFAEKVVIVEGDSEKYILPIYYKYLGFDIDKENIAVVHAHGKGPIDRLLRIFSGFEIPTFVWFDGDKNNKDKQVKDKSLELLKIFGQNVNDAKDINTVINHNFAILELTLEDQLRAEINDYEKLVAQAKAELGNDIGKPLIHKYIAKQLTKDKEDKEESIPTTIKTICERIHSLDKITPVLKIEEVTS